MGKERWIPASAGMTIKKAGMTQRGRAAQWARNDNKIIEGEWL